MGGWKRGLAVVGVFTLVGPPVGVLALSIEGLILSVLGGYDGGADAWAGLIGMALLSYLFGGLPAALAGVSAALLSRRIMGLWRWLVACVCLGALTSVAFSFALFPGADWADPNAWRAAGLMAILGGLAALVCGALTRNLRPKP